MQEMGTESRGAHITPPRIHQEEGEGLISSLASHNFILTKLVEELGLEKEETPPYREFPSYMLMDTNDMSYGTLYNMQEFPSLGDPHSDMRLDIDGMSYEELLELSEWINDNSKRGLSEDIITKHMQTKSYLLPENLGDQESDICIICQDEYKNKEEIGILQCGHEYHAECVKRWLHEKNVCPICKSKGLTIEKTRKIKST
ncbi:probable E3 ubiquitin-protein ligase RHG1A [Vigna radiata var. radiata]|uniref:RING-type E3 ubiquitin transferase n=1 Tax=Vigna radiata var. radiata TaxID=3916 RepID=A0A1S3T8E9_VIGRR|nr:probable E3 ubiquitin-protein ligase RHG1A [Vigna radiata var. radiata]